MDMTGEYRIPAPRQAVWEALNDPETLKAAIVGCDELNRTGENSFEAKVTAKVGPVKARFGGKIHLEDIDAPKGYRIVGEGSGGAAGFAKGGAKVDLVDEGEETLLRYEAKADVGGKLAQIGSRLVAGTAKKMADDFFGRFSKLVAERNGGTGDPVAASPLASTAAPPAAAAVGGPVIETPPPELPEVEEPGVAAPRSDASLPRLTESDETAIPPASTGAPETEEPMIVGSGIASAPPPAGLVAVSDDAMRTSPRSEPEVKPASTHEKFPQASPAAQRVDEPIGYDPDAITTAPVTAPPGPVPAVPETVEAVSVDDPARTSADVQAAVEPSAMAPPPPLGARINAGPGSPARPTPTSTPVAKKGLPWLWIIVAIVVIVLLLIWLA